MFLLLMRYNSSQYRIPCTRIFSFSFNFFPISYFYLFFFLFACSFSFGQTTNIVIKRRERKKRTRIGKKEENRKSSFFFCVYAVNEESFVQKNPSSFLRARTKNLYICYKTYRIYTYTKFFFFLRIFVSIRLLNPYLDYHLYYRLYYKILLRGKLFFHFSDLPDKD